MNRSTSAYLFQTVAPKAYFPRAETAERLPRLRNSRKVIQCFMAAIIKLDWEDFDHVEAAVDGEVATAQ